VVERLPDVRATRTRLFDVIEDHLFHNDTGVENATGRNHLVV